MSESKLSICDHDLLTEKLGYVQGMLSLLYSAVSSNTGFDTDGVDWVVMEAQERIKDALSCIKNIDTLKKERAAA